MPPSLLLTGSLLLLAGCVGLPKAPAPTNPARFLSVNDLVGLDTLPDGNGGIARIATLEKRIASEGPVLLVVAGDFLGPSLASRFFGGRPMVEALNAAGVDYVTFGRHDFEEGFDSLTVRIAASRFKWLSANCTDPAGRPIAGVLPWDTLRVYQSRLGLFGLTAAHTAPDGTACTDPAAAARAAIDTLARLGVDMIVAITHQPLDDDVDLLTREGQLDLVLGGDTETAATVASGARHVAKADGRGQSAQFVTMWGAKGQWREAPRLLDVRPNLAPDPAVARVVSAWRDSVSTRLGPDAVVGYLVDTLDARQVTQRRGESALGNLVTDGIRAGTGADVALLNAGALRIDGLLLPGPLTRYELESYFPFGDDTRVVVVTLSGSRLRDVLEQGVSDQSLGRGGYLQVSGVRYVVDRSRPSGSRIVGPITRFDNRLVTVDERLRVALPGYLACAGGDGYRVPEASAACASAEPGPRVVDLLASHIAERLGGRASPPPGGRVTIR
ncbi:MAG: 5'-nucleotidase C-terminal domain-containing protein [Gemmatimonadales bacterium]|nr:5'-nucleotidase C-terminal domain-containing protein [Gemmatimonadales bacterium]